MMERAMRHLATVSVSFLCAVAVPAFAAGGDATRGARAFRACAACHSLEPNRNMTGPSLAGVWNRKAGTASGFTRYSAVMKHSDVTWKENALDAYLKNPEEFMPGNHMTFAGISDEETRADIVAFLKENSSGQTKSSQAQMEGMMSRGRGVAKLKGIGASSRVKAITYCGDTFKVTTVDGNTRDFWERNLRFKTDSSDDGPEKDAPAILAAGMMGDRASIVFASPDEISVWIKHEC
jgi:cytochrome c